MAYLKEYLWSGKWLYKSCLFFFQRFSLQVFRVRAAHFTEEVKQPALKIGLGCCKASSFQWCFGSFQKHNSSKENWVNQQPCLPTWLFCEQQLINVTANQLQDRYCVTLTDLDLFSLNSFHHYWGQELLAIFIIFSAKNIHTEYAVYTHKKLFPVSHGILVNY